SIRPLRLRVITIAKPMIRSTETAATTRAKRTSMTVMTVSRSRASCMSALLWANAPRVGTSAMRRTHPTVEIGAENRSPLRLHRGGPGGDTSEHDAGDVRRGPAGVEQPAGTAAEALR